MRKRLLFSSLLVIPTITSLVVSCSKSHSNNLDSNVNDISYETKKIYDVLIDPSGLNKAAFSFNNTNPKISKSKEEVLKLAEQKLETISTSELKNYFLNSCLKGAYLSYDKVISKIKELSAHSKSFIDIKNFSFDIETKEVSFDYIYKWDIWKRKINDLNLENNWYGTFVINVKGLKIKADTLVVSNKIFPIFSFEINQPNMVMTCRHSDFISNFDEKFETEYFNRGKKTVFKEPLALSIQRSIKSTKYISTFSYVSYLNNRLGHVNDKFQLEINFNPSVLDNAIFNWWGLGFRIDELNEGDGGIYDETKFRLETQAASISSPIFFSKLNKDGTIDWESYNLI